MHGEAANAGRRMRQIMAQWQHGYSYEERPGREGGELGLTAITEKARGKRAAAGDEGGGSDPRRAEGKKKTASMRPAIFNPSTRAT